MTALYDDPFFFEQYLKLREDARNYNDLIEQPIMYDLISTCDGMSALDIGCGYGNTCRWLSEHGAASVLGIDTSSKMIQRAIAVNNLPNVDYQVMDAGQLDSLDRQFDIVVSSLAFHYIEDFPKLIHDIKNLLKGPQRLVFSMEHPIYTARKTPNPEWEFDDEGRKTAYHLDNYGAEGRRDVRWLDTEIVKFHLRTDTVINTLIDEGFALHRIVEPVPTEQMMASYERTVQELHRPAYLIVSASLGK